MSLDRILEALDTEAERQVMAIEQAAQAEIEHIRAQAQVEATAVRQKRIMAVQGPLQAERARILNRAKLEALQIVMGARETLIESALEAAAHHLAALPTTKMYARQLQALIQEIVDTLGGNGQLHLHLQSRDVELANCIIQEMNLPATLEGDLESKSEQSLAAARWGCLGGVIATTSNGRISLVNTLEARLQRVADLYRSQIAGMVFDDRQEG